MIGTAARGTCQPPMPIWTRFSGRTLGSAVAWKYGVVCIRSSRSCRDQVRTMGCFARRWRWVGSGDRGVVSAGPALVLYGPMEGPAAWRGVCGAAAARLLLDVGVAVEVDDADALRGDRGEATNLMARRVTTGRLGQGLRFSV